MTLEDDFLKSKTEDPEKKTFNIKFGVKLKKVPPGVKMKDVKALFSGLSIKNVLFQKGAVALVALTSQDAVQKALATKNPHLGNHSILIRPLPSFTEPPKGKGKGGGAGGSGFKREFFPQRNQKDMEKEIEETGRLFFRNLSYDMSEGDLDALCAPFGLLAEALVPWDAAASRNRGFGFVTFVHPQEAVRAFRALDKKVVNGRKLHVLPSKEPPADPQQEEDEDDKDAGTKTAFQRERLAKRKKTEGTAAAERTWNPLLINAAALAEVQAAELGVSKEKLLDSRTRGSAAVRLAQLELVLIGELEEFLKGQGAHIPSLKGKEEEEGVVVRSRNAFLIKNLPAFAKKEELEPLLSRHGDLKSLKMGPKGLIAVAHFRQSVQARRAFAFLAFSEFKDSVLKVEWLPKLQTEFAKEEEEEGGEKEEEAGEASSTEEEPVTKETPSKKRKREEEVEDNEKIEVKKNKKRKHEETEARSEENDEVPFKRTKKNNKADKMEQEVQSKGPTHSSQEDESPKKSKKEQTKEMSKKDEVKEKKSKKDEEASKKDEVKEKKSKKDEVKEKKSKKDEEASKKDEVKEKKSKKDEEASKKEEVKEKKSKKEPAKEKFKTVEEGRSSTVVLVRNVPFQANQKELLELFRPFGELARVRLPVKPGGGIRGFAFAEFADEESAQALIAADQRMHLYGRRLRLEAALADTAVSSIREKALSSLTGAMEAEQQRKRRAKVQLEPELPPDAV